MPDSPTLDQRVYLRLYPDTHGSVVAVFPSGRYQVKWDNSHLVEYHADSWLETVLPEEETHE